jgi:hypothetical protein
MSPVGTTPQYTLSASTAIVQLVESPRARVTTSPPHFGTLAMTPEATVAPSVVKYT